MQKLLKNNLIKNYLYNLGFTIYNLLVPMIILPYVSKILGRENIGINSFVFSLNQYFILFANLGILLYGSREVAFVRNDRKKLNETVIDLFLLKVISSLVTLGIYIIFIQFQEENLKKYMYLYSVNIIAVIFDITWIFQGLEDFKKVAIRNFIVKTFSIICILKFIKSIEDLDVYIIIISFSTFFSNIIMLKYVLRIIELKEYKYKYSRIKKHFFNNNKLFFLQISIQLYAYIDKIMLGYFGKIIETGYYDIAQQVTRIGISLNGALTSVMIPRVTKLFSENKISDIKNIINKSLIFSLSFSFPIIFGMLAIKDNMITLFFGVEFNKVKEILPLLLPIIFIVPIGNVLGMQLMIPMKKEKVVAMIPMIGLLISIVLNFILIPKLGILGAVIASLSVESCGSFLAWYFTKEWIDIIYVFKKSGKSCISAVLMYIIIMNIKNQNEIHLILIKIMFGIFCYILSMAVLEYKLILEKIRK